MATRNPVKPLVAANNMVSNDLRKQPHLSESLIKGFLFFCGILSIFTTIAIVFILLEEAVAFFGRTQWENTNRTVAAEVLPTDQALVVSSSGGTLRVEDVIRLGDEIMLIVSVDGVTIGVERGYRETTAVTHSANLVLERANDVDLIKTFTTTKWIPQLGHFGLWPLMLATIMTSIIAMIVALPIGLASAIYLSEYASERFRSIMKPILEVLAGIPTVVYGYFALIFMTPLLRSIFGQGTVEIFNVASAGIVIGILIIPLVSSMSEDALHAVPDSLRQAAYGLGATRLETSLKVVLPAALSGVTAAFVVAMSRAVGETMVVAIAAGAGPRNFELGKDPLFGFILNPFIAAETMTGHIVRISGGDLSYDSIDYNSLFAIGLLLFVMTFILNVIARRFVERFREVYD
jgi:phosphate transport system permease protein